MQALLIETFKKSQRPPKHPFELYFFAEFHALASFEFSAARKISGFISARYFSPGAKTLL
jgi:hypothetical protein